MIVLFGSLFVLASGLVWVVFHQRISRNLPKKDNPARRDITPAGVWTPLRVGQAMVLVGLVGVVVFLIWFR